MGFVRRQFGLSAKFGGRGFGSSGQFGSPGTSTPPFNILDLGSDLVVYLDAESVAGADNDIVATIPNQGTGGDFSGNTGIEPILKIIGGKRIIRHAAGQVATSDASIAAMAAHTTYIVARPTTTTTNSYFLKMGDLSHAILEGYVDGKWEYFATPRTEIADIDVVNFQMVKCTVGDTAAGNWAISDNTFAGDWKVIIAVKRALTPAEETGVEALLASRL